MNNEKRGADLLNDPLLNRGTAFSLADRQKLGLHGLLPPNEETLEQQVERVLLTCAAKPTDLERYIYLMALQDQNETLFYRTILSDLPGHMPIIYTPTVGEAAMNYGEVFRRARGLYITLNDKGNVKNVLKNWPRKNPEVIVATDGGRVLGLGDLGVNGMTISIGKLALYTAAGGVHPANTLPIVIDVGTNTKRLSENERYLGLRQPRATGDEYLALMDEFVDAVKEVFPNTMLQFEDLSTDNAIPLLARYRDKMPLFNDDIQGTAAVTLAGILGGLRISGGSLEEKPILFVGAGSANTGIADLVASAIAENGKTIEEARNQLWFMDSKGLIVEGRAGIKPHVLHYAQAHDQADTIKEAVEVVKPAVLIGATGQPGIFDQGVVEAMSAINDKPIIFALSNPTSRSEATAKDVYNWSKGKAVFASGSPFDPVDVDGRTHVPGQSNNAYIFPGIGLGISACQISRVTDGMFRAAANAVATGVSQDALDQGLVFPALDEIRDVSLDIAVAISELAFNEGLAGIDKPSDLRSYIADKMYSPEYGS